MKPQPDRVTGGARAYPGQNGDTAKPAERFNPSERPDYLQDWDRLVPYGRARENGTIVRVETDGRGGLVEFVESSTGELIWGATRGDWRKLRASTPRNPPIATGNLKRVCRRYGYESRALQYLHRHQQGGTGARYGAIAAQVGTSLRYTSLIMLRLRDQGYARYRYGREQNTHGGQRAIVFWYASDRSYLHLPNCLLRMIATQPMHATHAAQLLDIEYGRVVKALADLYAAGEIARRRDGPRYIYAALEEGGDG